MTLCLPKGPRPPTVRNLRVRSDLLKWVPFSDETSSRVERAPKLGLGVGILILHFLLIKNSLLSEVVFRFFQCLVNVKGHVDVKSEDIKLPVFKIYLFIFGSVYDHVAGIFLNVYRCLCWHVKRHLCRRVLKKNPICIKNVTSPFQYWGSYYWFLVMYIKKYRCRGIHIYICIWQSYGDSKWTKTIWVGDWYAVC